MPFRQPEYEEAFDSLASREVDALVAADPVLSRIQRRRTSGPVAVAAGAGEVEQEQLMMAESVLDAEAITSVDVPAFQRWLTDIAREYVETTRAFVFAQIQAAAARAGQVIHVGSAPITWDAILDAFEGMDWPTDENGTVREPDVAPMPPGRLEDLGLRTPEQEQRIEAIRARKQKAQDAGRRNRRIP